MLHCGTKFLMSDRVQVSGSLISPHEPAGCELISANIQCQVVRDLIELGQVGECQIVVRQVEMLQLARIGN